MVPKNIMLKLSKILILTALILVVFGLASPAALAQTAVTETPVPTEVQPTPVPMTVGKPEDVILFSQLNQTESLLSGPYDGMRIRFSVPASWHLEEGAVIQLNLSTFFTSTVAGFGNDQSTGATLEVTFNNDFLTTIVLNWTGDKIVEIPIPASALVSARSDGRHDLELFLDAAVDCQTPDHKSSVIVREGSAFIFPHSLVPLPTDLTILPRPIFQPDAFLPGTATLVVPDAPTAAELQAALTVSAGFGRLTNARLPISLATVGGLSADVRDNSNLIFVGKGSSFASVLAGIPIPSPLTDAVFSVSGASPEDGIVQVAISPWNSAQLLLVVSGNTDSAVVKAAQAVSTGTLRTAGRPDLALIADVLSSQDVPAVPPDRTFADLGYEAQNLSGIGPQTTAYNFFIPYGQAPSGAASLDLVFNSSALLDYQLSGMVIYLNDQVVGSARFSDDTAQTTKLNISLPEFALRPGGNRLVIEANIIPSYYCTDLRLNNLWVNINPESTLHIPLTDAAPIFSKILDLAYYPFPFISSPTLDSVTFVLAKDDSLGWNIASSLATQLGRLTFGRLVELTVTFSDAVPEELRQDNDIFVVGKPSQHPFVTDLNSNLPASYSEGSDIANESGPGVVYRLPEGTSVGYLQLITSPWNAKRAVLAVLGSTDQGLDWAGNALTDPVLRGKLSGNYAVVSNQQVVTADTRLSSGTGNLAGRVVPTSEVQTQSKPIVVPPPTTPVKQTWIVPTLIVSGLLMVVVLIIGLFGSFRGSRR